MLILAGFWAVKAHDCFIRDICSEGDGVNLFRATLIEERLKSVKSWLRFDDKL